MTKTKFTVNEAAKIVGSTRQTIYRHIESKPITTIKDANDNQLIEASELIRVYGEDINFDALNGNKTKDVTSNKLQDITPEKPPIAESVEDKIQLVKLEAQIENLKTQLESKEEETDYVKKLLEEEKAERKAANNLIEDHRDRESKWDQQFKAMEHRVSNFEKNTKIWEDRARKQLKDKKEIKETLDKKNQELEKAQNKTFFQKLFG